MDMRGLALDTSNHSNDDNNILSKLRRLRIQEALLLQSVQKQDKNLKYEELCNPSSYRELLKKIKDSYINLKNLYDEIKANTQSQELLADLDIDEIKKKVFELDTNIKTFKSDVYSELAALKLAEQDLNKQILEIPNEIQNVKQRPKTHPVNYNAIVPSPVRVMMTSPFKCSEVQEFQEFMKNSPNRYGGWNEYSHNLFVKHWQKFFGKEYSSEFEDEHFQQSITYKVFIEDLIPKLQGITLSAVTAHVQWYIQYLFLKEKQQNAIDKWKWSKTTARKVTKKVVNSHEEDSFPIETTTDAQNFIACNFNTNSYGPSERVTKAKHSVQRDKRPNSISKPTKQWLNRYQPDDGENVLPNINCIESLEKQLRTPHWRLGL